ncbi:MAG: hypothetical protein GY909_13720 [Oligoflexia bacterium]|nr:hypothetical protein [Oligoflexia bacterium]
MRILILGILIIISVSCEMHKQEAFSNNSGESKGFLLSKSDEAFKAISENEVSALRTILEEGTYETNALSENGKLLLNEAVKVKKVLITLLLLDNGADITLEDEEGNSALDLIADYAEKDQWEKLLKKEDLDSSFLASKAVTLVSETAIDTQDKTKEMLTEYFNYGVDVNSRSKSQFPLLAIAGSKALTELTRFLCEQDSIDVNAKIRRRSILAVMKKLKRRNPAIGEVIEILKSYGAR